MFTVAADACDVVAERGQLLATRFAAVAAADVAVAGDFPLEKVPLRFFFGRYSSIRAFAAACPSPLCTRSKCPCSP